MVNNLRITIVVMALGYAIIGCSSGDGREQLSFDVPTKQIEDSIIKMNQLISKLPTENGSPFFKNCFIDNSGHWIINNKDIGFVDNVDLDKVNILDTLIYNEKESLRTIVKFLNANKITAGFRTGENCYMYSYKHRKDDEYYTSKYIVLKNLSCNYLFSQYEVIDSSGNVLLIEATR